MQELILTKKSSEKTNQPRFSIKDLSKRYEILVADTSALSNSLGFPTVKTNENIAYRTAELGSQRDSAKLFSQFLVAEGNLYTTSAVLGEYFPTTNGNYRKKIRETNRHHSRLKKAGVTKENVGSERVRLDSAIVSLERVFRESSTEKRRLVESFTCLGHEIKLDEKEQGLTRYLNERYVELKKRFGLSDVDFELLVYSGVISFTRGKTALLSNDYALLYAWADMISNEKFSPDIFSFFTRPDMDIFRKAYPKIERE
jgi:hypothetical protein